MCSILYKLRRVEMKYFGESKTSQKQQFCLTDKLKIGVSVTHIFFVLIIITCQTILHACSGHILSAFVLDLLLNSYFNIKLSLIIIVYFRETVTVCEKQLVFFFELSPLMKNQ